MRLLKNIVLYIIAAALLLSAVPMCASAAKTAENIAKSCTFTASYNNSYTSRLFDGSIKSSFTCGGEGEHYIDISFNGADAAGIYVMWDTMPTGLYIFTDTGAGFDRKQAIADVSYQQYISVESGTKAVRLYTQSGKSNIFSAFEIEVYSQGELPESVHIWQPTPTTADFMLISCHQDDELLFFGGAIPYYGGELGYDTVVVYVTLCSKMRYQEALNGLWTAGLRQYPVFLNYYDHYYTSLAEARGGWDCDKLIADFTRLIAQTCPQVVTTHDINGEYGHNQHKLCNELVTKAVENANNADYLSSIGTDLEPWQVNKYYIHLYEKNQITVPWEEYEISSLGVSSYQAAVNGYQEHKSQLHLSFAVRCYGANDCRKFGLYSSTVGEDVQKRDMFENVTVRTARCKVKDDDIYSGMERVYSTADIYSYTDSLTGETKYARYCSCLGEQGWYACDASGGVGKEPQKLAYFTDGKVDIENKENIEATDNPLLYKYSSEGKSVILRFGSLNGSANAFFEADENGVVSADAQTVYIKGVSEQENQNGGLLNLFSGSIIEVSVYFTLIAAFLFFAVMVIILYCKRKG